MSLPTDPLQILVSPRTFYVLDPFQRAIHSVISEQLAAEAPGGRIEDVGAKGPSSPPGEASLPGEPEPDIGRSGQELPARPVVIVHIANWHSGSLSSFAEGGTSMASPVIAGTAALLFSSRPGMTTEEIRVLLREMMRSNPVVLVSGDLGPEALGDRPARAFRPEEAEQRFRGLGNWKNAAQGEAAREYWRTAGVEGIEWLVRRLRSERHVEVLHDAAALLADLGRGSIGPVLEELACDPAPDQALALLRALGWLGETSERPTLEGAQGELTLAELLQHGDPDIREAAACAMRLLRPERAAHWLSMRRRVEPDANVREAIDDELARYQARSA
jgi:hypothetical protein